MFAKLAVTVTLAVLAIAAPAAEDHVHRRQGLARVITNCNNKNTVALTFDDGPNIYEKQVSDVLTKNGAKGTFFYNGNNYRCIYDADMVSNVQYVYKAGHQIGSHTWAHEDLTTLSTDQINQQMMLSDQAISRITGATPAFFRPPYGNYNDNVLQVAAQRGQSAVMWSFDSEDSVGASSAQQKTNFDNIAKKYPAPLLSLEHSVYQTTPDVLEHAIETLKAAGYKNFVTVAECVGEQPYQKVGAAQSRNGDWHC